MQKITYFCDRCGKQIEKTVCQLATIRIILPGDGSIGMTSEDIDTGADLCESCFEACDNAVLQEIQAGKQLQQIQEAKQKKLAETVGPKIEKRKQLDMGKIKVLRDAGWTLEKIADEMGVSAPTISSRLNKEKQEGTK